ncbi:hypothetical protein V6N13_107640 [Hibiscus sabdariffa]|uniref:Uncharacterized protein n=1 Tax=Hibiscus sabdariffa TaxID=183260 RepID=A0ABR2SQN3_9ROSI
MPVRFRCSVAPLDVIFTGQSDFIENWISICLTARTKVKSEFHELSFQELCEHCEKAYLLAHHTASKGSNLVVDRPAKVGYEVEF